MLYPLCAFYPPPSPADRREGCGGRTGCHEGAVWGPWCPPCRRVICTRLTSVACSYYFFFTPLKNMQAEKTTTGLVPLGNFFFQLFYFGSSYLLASVCLGAPAWTWLQWLWLVCSPTPPPQSSGLVLLGGSCSPCPSLAGREEVLLLFLLLLIFPFVSPISFPWQPAITAARPSQQRSCCGLNIFPFCFLPCIAAVVESE